MESCLNLLVDCCNLHLQSISLLLPHHLHLSLLTSIDWHSAVIAYYQCIDQIVDTLVAEGCRESVLDEMTANLIMPVVDELHCWESVDHGMDQAVVLLEVDSSASLTVSSKSEVEEREEMKETRLNESSKGYLRS